MAFDDSTSEASFELSETRSTLSPDDQEDALYDFRRTRYLKRDNDLARQHGNAPALFLASMVHKYDALRYKDGLQKDGSFFFTHAAQRKLTGMSEYTLRRCKKRLIELGAIRVKWQGSPAKERYYLNHANKWVRSHDYRMISVDALVHFGIGPAIVLANLVDKYELFRDEYPCPLRSDGSFYLTHSDQQNELNLTEYAIIESKKALRNLGIIATTRDAALNRECYCIDFVKLLETIYHARASAPLPRMHSAFTPKLKAPIPIRSKKEGPPELDRADIPIRSKKEGPPELDRADPPNSIGLTPRTRKGIYNTKLQDQNIQDQSIYIATLHNQNGSFHDDVSCNTHLRGSVTETEEKDSINLPAVSTSSSAQRRFTERDVPPMSTQTAPTMSDKKVKPSTEAHQRIFNFWNTKAGHIHGARYTSNLDSKIRTRLKTWHPTQILRAIHHYVRMYDDPSHYYKHKWTLLAFLSQSNGVPRFVAGLDDKYDGDLWRNYRDDRRCPTRLRNSAASSSTKPKNGAAEPFDPAEYFAEELTYYANFPVAGSNPPRTKRVTFCDQEPFIRDVYEPAIKLIQPKTDAEREELAHALAERWRRCRQLWEQERNRRGLDEFAYSSLKQVRVCECFVEWIGEQDWITHRRPAMFLQDGLFDRFYAEHYHKTQSGAWA